MDPSTTSREKRKLDEDKIKEPNRNKNLKKANLLVMNKGEWVTHLSLPIEFNKSQLDLIESLTSRLKATFAEKITSIAICDEFHLTVSRTLRVKKQTINELTNSIEAKFKSKSKFNCFFNDVVLLKSGSDEEGGEKLFLAFKVNPNLEPNSTQANNLNSLVDDVNTCLKSLNLPGYYKNPIFHISFAYLILPEEPNVINDLISHIKKEISAFLVDVDFKKKNLDDEGKCLDIQRIKLKCGNNLTFFKLI